MTRSARELAEAVRQIVLNAERHYANGGETERERRIEVINRLLRELEADGIVVMDDADMEQ